METPQKRRMKMKQYKRPEVWVDVITPPEDGLLVMTCVTADDGSKTDYKVGYFDAGLALWFDEKDNYLRFPSYWHRLAE